MCNIQIFEMVLAAVEMMVNVWIFSLCLWRGSEVDEEVCSSSKSLYFDDEASLAQKEEFWNSFESPMMVIANSCSSKKK